MSASHEIGGADSKGKAEQFPRTWKYCCDMVGSFTIPVLQQLFSGTFLSLKAFFILTTKTTEKFLHC